MQDIGDIGCRRYRVSGDQTYETLILDVDGRGASFLIHDDTNTIAEDSI